MNETKPIPAAPRSILIVDDDESLGQYLQVALRLGTHCRVELAGDGASGLQMAKELAPALIILDLMLPDMDGFEFLSALRSQPQQKAVPVVAISIHAWDRALRDRLLAAGCTACLDKSHDMDSLIPLVKSYLDDSVSDR